MENAVLVWLGVVAVVALLLGGLIGATGFSSETEVKVPGETQTIIQCTDGSFVDNSSNCPPEEELPEAEIIEVEVEMDLEDQYLNPAIDDIFDEFDRDDDFLTCGEFEYDEDEIEFTKILEWSYTWYDDDEYGVDVRGKLKFDEDDERSCRETRTYSLFYEDGEDVEVELID